jgi:membrane protein
MMKKLWHSPPVYFFREATMLYLSRRVPQAAACLAYFMLLTVFPLLICVSAVLGLVHIDIASLVLRLQPILPDAAVSLVASYLRYVSLHQSPGFFVAGLAGCWFSAAAAFRTITRVIIDMYEDVSQSMLRGMVTSILFPVALLLTVDLSIIVVVTGQRTLQSLSQRFPFLVSTLNLWSWIKYVLLFFIFFLFVLAVLNMAAPFGTPRLPVLVSSLVSSLALVVSSAVFSWFISLSSRYSLVYGSLVSMVVLLIWLYLCGQLLFLSIVFTSVWYNTIRHRKG